MRITLKQLEVFFAIAKSGNVSHAAKKMQLSQSACSMALAALEDQLEGFIFDRHGKQLFLNERGRALLPKATAIIAQIKELKALMTTDIKERLAGDLVVGASQTIGNYLLPQLISEFSKTHKNIQVKLQISNAESILAQLLSFNVDIGLIETNCFSNKINSFPWKNDRLIIVASSKNPLSKKRKITLSDLKNARWILQETHTQIREKLEELLGGSIEPYLQLADTEAIKQATQAGLGISCLSKLVVGDALASHKLVELKTPFLNLSREFNIIIHKEKYQSSILTEFIKQCA